MSEGVPIVLTADRSLMAAHALLLDGMAAAAQTTAWASRLMWPLIAPRVAADGLRARQAPLGLRRIEAALLGGGFSESDVAVVPPERAERAIGPRTRVVGLSSGDPLGLGMNSTTIAAVFGGRPITSALFQQLLAKVRQRIAAVGSPARVVLGGPGTWQAEQDEATIRKLGIDHVVTGYSEANAAEVLRAVSQGAEMPFVVRGKGPSAAAVPPVRGATVMGMVEVSRGCGWGCRFCTLADQPMFHLPLETILADAETNLSAGVRNLSLTGEDVFRYGAGPGEAANPAAVLELGRRLAGLSGVATLAIDHANVSTVSCFSDGELREFRRLVALGREDFRPWVNLGVETASGELLVASSSPAKLRPASASEWGRLCAEQVRRLCASGFLPMVSLVVGLPGEEARHVEETMRWIDALDGQPISLVPVFLTPVRADGGQRVGADGLTKRQWTLFARCMRSTFRWMPGVYWRHQAAAGVKVGRRLVKQVLGRGYAMQWRCILWRKGRAARS